MKETETEQTFWKKLSRKFKAWKRRRRRLRRIWLSKFGKNKTQNTLIGAFGWIAYLIVATTFAQCLIYLTDGDWKGFGLSILVGTCGVTLGGFSALLASPYNLEDEKRISRVTTTIATLVTGYILGKIIDPLIANVMKEPNIIFILLQPMKNSANVLIGIISFMGGFLATYQFRAYISAELFLRGEESSDKER